jgi:hypothetical protein
MDARPMARKRKHTTPTAPSAESTLGGSATTEADGASSAAPPPRTLTFKLPPEQRKAWRKFAEAERERWERAAPDRECLERSRRVLDHAAATRDGIDPPWVKRLQRLLSAAAKTASPLAEQPPEKWPTSPSAEPPQGQQPTSPQLPTPDDVGRKLSLTMRAVYELKRADDIPRNRDLLEKVCKVIGETVCERTLYEALHRLRYLKLI